MACPGSSRPSSSAIGSAPPARIVLDARLLGGSGIGRHLGALLPRLLARLATQRVTLLVHPGQEPPAPTAQRRVPLALAMYDPRVALLGMHPAVAGADVLWTPHFPHPVLGPPVVATLHDVLHLEHPELFANPLAAPVARMWLRSLRRRAAGIAFVSAFTAAEFSRKVGPPRCPTILTPNAVDDAWWGAPAGSRPWPEPYLLALGNLKPHKGLETAAAAVLRDPALPALVLIGAGPRGSPGGRLAEALAARRARFLGRLDDGDVRRHLAHAEALLFPSLYEGFGIPPLEAMAAGIPVVAADIPAVREVCGAAALLHPPGDDATLARQVRRLMTDRGLRDTLVAIGRARINLFSWDASADALAELLLRVAARHRG